MTITAPISAPAGGAEGAGPAAVEFQNVSKRFGSVAANDGVSFTVPRGSICGIVGENGAGKSTAMKLLYGMIRPDQGRILVGGVERNWRSPAEAIAAGIGMVHQHFMLAGALDALDNILVGAEPRRRGMLDRGGARRTVEELSQAYGLAVDLDRPVEDLPVGVQQRVEILKLLFRRAEILILDEPSAVLTPIEVTALFQNLARLRAEGKTILLITHKLREIMDFTDRVAVFRAGRVVGEMATSTTSSQELADLMVGRKVSLQMSASPAAPRQESALRVEALAAGGHGGRSGLGEVSFELKQGEILGIAGVEGNGQSELLRAILFPSDRACRTRGRVWVLGREVTDSQPGEIRSLGVAVIPEDRLREGILPERPAAESFVLGRQREDSFGRWGWLDPARVRAAFQAAATQFDIRPPDPDLSAGRFSGGNQQKIVLAREFGREPRLVIAAQPTRGVDVGAIEAIHQRIVRVRDEGAGVLLVSSELDEILALSDRILVMFNGRFVAEFARGRVTEREIGLKMGGA